MRPAARLLMLLLLTLSACSTPPTHIESATTPALPAAPERYIIAAVDNEPVALTGHAGSSPRGYDNVATYGPSPRAQRVMQDLARDYGLHAVTSWPIEPLRVHCAIFEVPADSERNTLLAALTSDRRIRLVQPLQTFATRSQTYNDPYVELQRGFQRMNVADAHPLSRGEGVKIAIVDTGIDIQHPDLRGAIILAANFVDADDRQFVSDRHGTEVAGAIAATANNREGIVGVAPGAKLLAFKSCWQLQPGSDVAHCNSFTLARGLSAALAAHAQVINLSLAGPDDPLLHNLIQEGIRRGVIFVGAASGETSEQTGQLLHQAGVIEVGSTESPDPGDSWIHAPGREILTLLPQGHYDFASGSSLATAQVTGAVALLLARNSRLSSVRIFQLLHDTSEQLATDANTSVNACAAVVQLVGHGTCKTAKPNLADASGTTMHHE